MACGGTVMVPGRLVLFRGGTRTWDLLPVGTRDIMLWNHKLLCDHFDTIGPPNALPGPFSLRFGWSHQYLSSLSYVAVANLKDSQARSIQIFDATGER